MNPAASSVLPGDYRVLGHEHELDVAWVIFDRKRGQKHLGVRGRGSGGRDGSANSHAANRCSIMIARKQRKKEKIIVQHALLTKNRWSA